MGVREQIIFPEIDYDAIDQVRGLDITITTTAQTDAEAYALLEAFGMPFSREGNPYVTQTSEEPPRWPRRPSACARRAPPSTRPASTPGAAAAAASRAVYRKFGVCRICLRELAHNGYIPGMTKSSW